MMSILNCFRTNRKVVILQLLLVFGGAGFSYYYYVLNEETLFCPSLVGVNYRCVALANEHGYKYCSTLSNAMDADKDAITALIHYEFDGACSYIHGENLHALLTYWAVDKRVENVSHLSRAERARLLSFIEVPYKLETIPSTLATDFPNISDFLRE